MAWLIQLQSTSQWCVTSNRRMNILDERRRLQDYIGNYEDGWTQCSTMLVQSDYLGPQLANEIDNFFSRVKLDLDGLQCKLNEALKAWRAHQQQSIITGHLDKQSLTAIQMFNTDRLNFIHKLDAHLAQLLTDVRVQNHTALKLKLIDVRSSLDESIQATLQNAMVVLEQPCSSIMKHDPLTIISNAKFDIKLALIIDHRMVSNIHSLKIEINLLREDELMVIVQQGLHQSLQRRPSFMVINKTDPVVVLQDCMAHISLTGSLRVDMNRRGHNPKALPVTEEKFKFVIHTQLEMNGNELTCDTFSLPVNVLSRKDYPNSYATILWDNAFSLPDRIMFETREVVHWSQLAPVLAAKFYKDVGVPLLEEHLEFIHTVLPNRNDDSDQLVSWEQFARVALPMRQFTFFEWFYRIITLVREQLLPIYRDGLIHGFISSSKAEEMLANCVDGTFLFRFSESYCGSISIAYVHDNTFHKLCPWDLDRLRKISLPHTIKCSSFLQYLYPHHAKDDVFSKYYVCSEDQPSISGKDYTIDTNVAQVIGHYDSFTFK